MLCEREMNEIVSLKMKINPDLKKMQIVTKSQGTPNLMMLQKSAWPRTESTKTKSKVTKQRKKLMQNELKRLLREKLGGMLQKLQSWQL